MVTSAGGLKLYTCLRQRHATAWGMMRGTPDDTDPGTGSLNMVPNGDHTGA